MSSKKTTKQKKPLKRGSTYQLVKRRVRSKQPARNSRRLARRKQPSKIRRITRAKAATMKKIVRIMGHGQFSVDHKILQRLNEIDDLLVQLVRADRPNDNEFKKHLIELTKIVEQNGKQLDSKEIIQSDIILPSADLSLDEAKRLFTGEGVVPEI
ncbi:MAG TPA: hypothetical protein VE643_01455 [Nitrososphaeraceae archaeon]|nr:hypothetical protein [Nitrososphaeraceae archaeon]